MSTNDQIGLRPVCDLLESNFYIPAYQRGYRWDEDQVTDLLEDIWEFSQLSGKQEGEFYCLQPVIVKKEKHHFRLIDGQQRLTTLYILLSYLEGAIDVLGLSNNKFSIEYQTRPDSKHFLEDIIHIEEIHDSNIDYYYMSKAFLTIKNWFEVGNINKGRFVNTLLESIHNDEGKEIGNNVRVIWYEVVPDDNESEVFSRINSGKIPLTNSELIKALFLNRKGFADQKRDIRRIEIAKEWDEIEYTLQDDEFWYFLTKNRNYIVRIELIFEILSNKLKKDDYSTYRYFSQQKNIVDFWSDNDENIKKTFLSLKYWYQDRELYHLIGFLIATDIYSVNKIYKKFIDMGKKEFKDYLYAEIKKLVNIDKLEELEYGVDNVQILRVLLLFNIATILNSRDGYVRFAFDQFNIEKWSIEHIHAQQDKGLLSHSARVEWLNNIKCEMAASFDGNENTDLLSDINNLLGSTQIEDDENFREIQQQVFTLFGDEADVDSISNLSLLSSQINSSLSNNVFPIKRNILIKKDKIGEFIPICTKNVFLKYYSSEIDNNHYWSRRDREDYLMEMKLMLSGFLG